MPCGATRRCIGMRDAPTLCAPPDTREYLAVLGVITTQLTGWRHSIRRSWLRSPDDGALVTRLVMRGLNASDEIISEADQFGDVVFLPSSTSLNKNRGPLQSTWQWFECASSAWPRARSSPARFELEIEPVVQTRDRVEFPVFLLLRASRAPYTLATTLAVWR